MENTQVQPGDTRSSIANRLGVSADKVGMGKSNNPDLIYPGETLQIDRSQPPVVPASTIGSSPQKASLPTDKPSTGASEASTMAATARNNAQMTLDRNSEVARLTAERDTLKQGLEGAMFGITQEQIVNDTQSKFNIPALSQSVAEINNKIEAKDLQYRRDKENIMSEAGLTAEQKSNKIRGVELNEAREMADLALVQNANLRNYQAMDEAAKQAIAAKTADQKMKVDYVKFVYDENKDLLSKEQDRQFTQLVKKEEREYDRQVKLEERNYQAKIAAAKLQSDLMSSTTLSAKQRQALLSNPTAKQAAARIGVINAVKAYNEKLQNYKGNKLWEWNRLTNAEKKELEAELRTTVGSAINVAQGQGAMGAEEGERILDPLEPRRAKRAKLIGDAANGIISGQNSLLQTDLSFIESAVPGATSQFEVFRDYQYGNMGDASLVPTDEEVSGTTTQVYKFNE